MGQASNELRELMRNNLFNELSTFFTNEEEGRRISAEMEGKFFQSSKSQEEYLTAFMKHLEQLKTLKQEAHVQSIAAVQSNPPPPSIDTKKPPTASLPATIVQQPAMADARSRSAEILDYLTQCQKRISPALVTMADPRQKAFFEMLISEIHSVRSALEQGMQPTHPELGPRIKLIVEKVRAVNKSQAQIQLQQQNLRQQMQQQRPPAMVATPAQLSRQVSVAQAVPDPVAATATANKRKRKPAGSGESRRGSTQKQSKASPAPTTPVAPNTAMYSGRSAAVAVSVSMPPKPDAADQNTFIPGINGFFEHVAAYDKKPKMNLLKQSAVRIVSMLQYIKTREGFEAAEMVRRASVRRTQQSRQPSNPVSPPTPAPPITPTPDRNGSDIMLESVAGQALLAAETVSPPVDHYIPDSAQLPYQRELEQIQSSGLFNITTLPRKNISWRLLRFDLNFMNISVPSLLVGIRNDYNEQECGSPGSTPSNCLDRIDYRAQRGNSSLSDQNILQIDALLRKCMLRRRPCLYDLVCTWHSAIKHVFSSDQQAPS